MDELLGPLDEAPFAVCAVPTGHPAGSQSHCNQLQGQLACRFFANMYRSCPSCAVVPGDYSNAAMRLTTIAEQAPPTAA